MTDKQASNNSDDSDKRQDNLLWLRLWKDNQTDFHRRQASPMLVRFWNKPTRPPLAEYWFLYVVKARI